MISVRDEQKALFSPVSGIRIDLTPDSPKALSPISADYKQIQHLSLKWHNVVDIQDP
jgi:hypothetical protein